MKGRISGSQDEIGRAIKHPDLFFSEKHTLYKITLSRSSSGFHFLSPKWIQHSIAVSRADRSSWEDMSPGKRLISFSAAGGNSSPATTVKQGYKD